MSEDTRQDFKGALRAFITTELRPGAEFGDDESLLEGGVLDSLGIIRLLELMQEEFGVDLPAEERDEMDNFETLDTINAMLLRHAGK